MNKEEKLIKLLQSVFEAGQGSILGPEEVPKEKYFDFHSTLEIEREFIDELLESPIINTTKEEIIKAAKQIADEAFKSDKPQWMKIVDLVESSNPPPLTTLKEHEYALIDLKRTVIDLQLHLDTCKDEARPALEKLLEEYKSAIDVLSSPKEEKQESNTNLSEGKIQDRISDYETDLQKCRNKMKSYSWTEREKKEGSINYGYLQEEECDIKHKIIELKWALSILPELEPLPNSKQESCITEEENNCDHDNTEHQNLRCNVCVDCKEILEVNI